MKAAGEPIESPELEDKIGQLRVLSFPDFPEVHEVDYYSALYRWYEDHPLSGKLYRWVSVTEEGEVVGYLTAFPQFYRIDGRRVVAHTPGDYMVLPQHGFQAIMLMRSFFRRAENCVVCDMVPAVIGIETRLGAELVGELQYAAKLMNVSRLPMPSVPAPARADPPAAAGSAERGPAGGGRGAGQQPRSRPRSRGARRVRRFLRRPVREGHGGGALHGREGCCVLALALWSRFPPVPRDRARGEISWEAARLRRAQSRLSRPGRLYTRPDGASRASGRRAGPATRDGTFLQADGRPDN